MEIRALSSRANNAEKRVINLQNQLLAAEEKVTAMNQKTTVADNKWESRVKEYEGRLRQAEEKIKRERQGGKERALELETQVRFVLFFFTHLRVRTLISPHRSYQRQVELAQKRIQQLNEIIDKSGANAKSSSPPSR